MVLRRILLLLLPPRPLLESMLFLAVPAGPPAGQPTDAPRLSVGVSVLVSERLGVKMDGRGSHDRTVVDTHTHTERF